jgi:hypothetical protein
MKPSLNNAPRIKAKIQLIKGARINPLLHLSSGKYMPHIVIGDPNQREVKTQSGTNNISEHYLGVRFVSGPEICDFEIETEVEMTLMYFPDVDYSEALPGKTFTLREGGKIVGFGTILSREQNN